MCVWFDRRMRMRRCRLLSLPLYILDLSIVVFCVLCLCMLVLYTIAFVDDYMLLLKKLFYTYIHTCSICAQGTYVCGVQGGRSATQPSFASNLVSTVARTVPFRLTICTKRSLFSSSKVRVGTIFFFCLPSYLYTYCCN